MSVPTIKNYGTEVNLIKAVRSYVSYMVVGLNYDT
jgi:hypothetical protein